jgi:hypothetical protein
VPAQFVWGVAGLISFRLQVRGLFSRGFWADNWGLKAARRKYEGSGRMRYMKTLTRKFKNGFREGTISPVHAASAAATRCHGHDPITFA